MSKTLGLALGAGGARGAAHAGFLRALDEEGVKPDYIAGSSMGAVVGGLYAGGVSPEEMEKIIRTIKKRDIIDFSPAFVSKMALLRTKKVHDLLHRLLGDRKIEDFAIPFVCVATDIYAGETFVFDSGEAALAIQASSTIPGVFRPVKYGNRLLVDGGCLCRVPVKAVKDMGADVVVAVDVLKNCAKPVAEVKNILSVMLRVYDVIDNNQTGLTRKLEGGMCDLLLEPELEGISQYDVKAAENTLEEGYVLGKANAQKIKELLK